MASGGKPAWAFSSIAAPNSNGNRLFLAAVCIVVVEIKEGYAILASSARHGSVHHLAPGSPSVRFAP